jgi:hypothetical protein
MPQVLHSMVVSGDLHRTGHNQNQVTVPIRPNTLDPGWRSKVISVALIIGLLVLWLVLAVVGFVVKSLLWLAILGLVLLSSRECSALCAAAHPDGFATERGQP